MIEVLLGGLVLAVAAAAILGAYVGQVTLNEHARNLSLAVQDANRVIERIREKTATCTSPDVRFSTVVACGSPAAVPTSWDDWLQRCGGGKSIQPDPLNNEHIAVECQASGGGAPVNCDGVANNPIRLTVSVCWRHRGRVIGDCNNVSPLTENKGLSGDANLVDSPAMLTTLVTCRG